MCTNKTNRPPPGGVHKGMLRMHICMCMYMYVYVCVCMCMYVYVCVYMCMYVYVCMCMYVYVCVCMCMCMYVCVCMCMYVYVCVCVCMYAARLLLRRRVKHSPTQLCQVRRTRLSSLRRVCPWLRRTASSRSWRGLGCCRDCWRSRCTSR